MSIIIAILVLLGGHRETFVDGEIVDLLVGSCLVTATTVGADELLVTCGPIDEGGIAS